MTLKELAVMSGVVVGRCDKAWGGTWQYYLKSDPFSTMCGYKTEKKLYEAVGKGYFWRTGF